MFILFIIETLELQGLESDKEMEGEYSTIICIANYNQPHWDFKVLKATNPNTFKNQLAVILESEEAVD